MRHMERGETGFGQDLLGRDQQNNYGPCHQVPKNGADGLFSIKLFPM